MSDSFTHVTNQSWLSRIGNSIKGILFGLLLFLAAFPLLFWNEGRAIETEKSLNEGAAAVVSIDANTIMPENNGHLVYLSGLADTDEILQDDIFKVRTQAIRLARKVNTYQWQEHSESKTEKNSGGSSTTTTTYNYSKEWSTRLINSSAFKHPQGHENPSRKRYDERTIFASQVKLGRFKLSPGQVREVGNAQTINLTEQNIPANTAARIVQGEVYIGDPDKPQVGDTRISLSEIKPTIVSIIAAQQGNSFAPYMTSVGKSIELLSSGVESAEEMFASELANNTLLTWGLRLLGFVIMTIGLSMVLAPLSVFADVIPFIGNIIEAGSGFIAAIIAFALSLTTIAIAWVFYRPLLAVVLIALVVGSIFYLKKKVKKMIPVSKAVNPPVASSVPPPPPS